MYRIIVLIVLLFLYLFFPSDASAVSVIITDHPLTISDDPFVITASISGASSGTNYLRIDIFKDQASPNYFGETFNNNDWYGGSIFSQYFPVTIQNGSWVGNIQGRVGSPISSQYDGTGNYKIRLRRYTGGGGYTASEANSSAVPIAIIFPTITPTPTNKPDPTSTLIPTKAPTPSKAPTATLIVLPTKRPTLVPTKIASKEGSLKAVLGTKSAEASISATPAPKKKDDKPQSVNILSIIFIIGGILALSACGILVFLKYKKRI